MSEHLTNPIFVELTMAVLTPGTAFEAMTHGAFWDMYGREITITKEDLAAFVENTKPAIEATITKSGELVGLPIDAFDHDKGDGAGWIVDLALDESGEKLLIYPNWTKIGVELISEKIRRWFSATVDLEAKVLLGGTLTNWPAMVDEGGKHLLQPIELQSPFHVVKVKQTAELGNEDTSLNEQISAVRGEFYEGFKPKGSEVDFDTSPWVREVFEDYLVVEEGGENFRVDYSQSKDGYEFTNRNDWIKVRQTWVEAMKNLIRDTWRSLVDNKSVLGAGAREAGDIKQHESEVLTMKLTKEELAEMVSEQVKESMTEFAKHLSSSTAEESLTEETMEGGEKFNVLEFLTLQNLEDEAKAELRQAMLDQFEAMRQQAGVEAAQLITRVRREAHIGEFCQRVTGGTEDNPVGIPVEANKLQDHILSLSPDQAEFTQNLIEAIWTNGVIKFLEKGHGKDVEGVKELPPYVAEALDKGELKVNDLTNPILNLGDLKQYDLKKWRQ